MLAYDELLLSDGATTIDLLSLATRTGAHLTSWRAGASRYKGGGYWHDSAIASGRRPAMHLWDAVEERMVFGIVGWTPDDLARRAAAVRNLLQQAWDYFEADLPQSVPVYLIRRVKGETNREYSLVLGGSIPEDVDYAAMRSEYGTVSFDGWDVEIWREEHWRDTIPAADPACVPNSGYSEFTQHIEFDAGAPTYIQVPAGAGLDNLPQATITVEAWIRINPNFGINTSLDIMTKCAVGPSVGWAFWWDTTQGLRVLITVPAANDAWAYAGVGALGADDVWHHVAFTYTDGAGAFPTLWIDGTASNLAQQARGGVPDADAASNLHIGSGFLGDIGWCRVSNAVLYALPGPFAAPVRCYLPDVTSASTVGQWIGGEVNGTTIDNQDGAAGFDGTLYNGVHDSDCRRGTVDAGLEPEYLCDEEDIPVFIRNAHVRAQPSHIFVLDQPASWSVDRVTSSAFGLLPTNSVAGDGLYVGITNENTLFYGPFFNLVFDIASAGTYTGTWQYYSTAGGPGWANLDVHDGTDGLENTGVVAVTWEVDTNDWEPLNVNGFTGYWVRFHLTAGHANRPMQQNRPVYTTAWACTEFQEASVPGDVPALAKIQCVIAGEEKTSILGSMEGHTADHLIFGMRSLSRGPDFCAYLNAGDPSTVGIVGAQEPIGVVPSDYAVYGVSTVDDTREQGLHVLCGGGASAWHSSQSWRVLPAYAWQYYGRYRLFLRAECTALNGTSRIRARIQTSGIFYTAREYYLTREYTFIDTDPEKLIDLGTITLPSYAPATSADVPWESLLILAETNFSDAADNIKLYGAILLPIDEKVVEAVTARDGYGGMSHSPATRVLIDSTSTLRTSIRSLTAEADGDIVGYMLPISTGAATFQANADQRIWMVAERYGPTFYWWSPHEFHAKMLLHRVARYRSVRGSR